MPDDYIPKVNDYVVWDQGEYGYNEGWVYFADKEYITIEVGVKPRPQCQLNSGKIPRHKMIHTLLLCFPDQWKELKYIKSRESKYD
jgi:hypothetical protein